MFDVAAVELIMRDGAGDFEHINNLYRCIRVTGAKPEAISFGEYIVCLEQLFRTLMLDESIEKYGEYLESRIAPLLYAFLCNILDGKGTLNRSMFLLINYGELVDEAIDGLERKKSKLNTNYTNLVEKVLYSITASQEECLGTVLQTYRQKLDMSWLVDEDIQEYMNRIIDTYMDLYWEVFQVIVFANTCDLSVSEIREKLTKQR